MNKHGKSNKKHKAIRVLESKAKKNDINALFQLAQYYESGQYVEENVEQAKIYFDKVLELFKSQSLQISSLKLVNFRVFENIDIGFCNNYKHNSNSNSNLTVIVGNNGAGKTTILEAIEKSLNWLILTIKSKTNSGRSDLIEPLDITNNSLVEYASIITKFVISEKIQYEIELSNSKKGSKSTRKGHYQEVRQLAELYKFANSRNAQFNFPIMAFYSVERALDITKKDTKSFDEVSGQSAWNQFDGYTDALNGTADFKLFFRWFKYFEDLDNSTDKQYQKLLAEIDKLKAELEGGLGLIKKIEKKANLEGEGGEVLNVFKQEKQEEIQNLEAKMNNRQEVQPSSIIYNVTKAIYELMPDFKNLRIQRSPYLDMLIDKDNVSLSVLQLSQGEKSLLALVADIARRLVLLNPSLDDPLKGNGVVLIDEIDLHLHPEWQQTILPNLMKTFPNIQFIVTTHSPQVLTTVHNSSIRILTSENIFNTSINTFGEESRTILEDVMHVDSRPKDPMTQKLKEYLQRINRGEIDSQDISSLRTELEIHFGESHSQLRLADLAVNRWLAVKKNKSIQKEK